MDSGVLEGSQVESGVPLRPVASKRATKGLGQCKPNPKP